MKIRIIGSAGEALARFENVTACMRDGIISISSAETNVVVAEIAIGFGGAVGWRAE